MKYQRAENGFSHPKSYYKAERDENDKWEVSGILYINGVPFQFSIHEQAVGCRYPLRGRIAALSFGKNKIMKMMDRTYEKEEEARRGKKHRKTKPELASSMTGLEQSEATPSSEETKNENSEARNIKGDIYSYAIIDGELDNEKLKKDIMSAAENLFIKYKADIKAVLKKLNYTVKNNSAEMAVAHLDAYLKQNYSSVKKRTYDKARRAIESVALYLGYVSMGDVTQAQIKDYVAAHKDAALRNLKYACGFWQYCLDKRVYIGTNPIDTYLSNIKSRRPKRDAKAELKKANSFDSLPFELEAKMNNLILSNFNNSFFLGLMLVKELRLHVPDVLALRWKDLIFGDEYVSIRIIRKNSAGATHDYTHPLFPFAAEVLLKRRTQLLLTISKEKLDELPVIPDPENPIKPLSRKKLNDFITNIFKREDIDLSSYTPAPGEPCGAGVRLLHKNHDDRLLNECGLEIDPAAADFLKGISLQTDVTADHYRNFIDKQSQDNLYTYLKRDTRFQKALPVEGNGINEERQPDGNIVYKISPLSPHKLTGFRVVINARPGDIFSVSSSHGAVITCNVRMHSKE